MISKKQIALDISQMQTLGTLVRVYEEIASYRMIKTRDSVIKNRYFLDELNAIFQEVRLSYAREVKKLVKKRKIGDSSNVTFLAHNGKTVAILLSSNAGLYGEITKTTFDAFLAELRSSDSEAAIVGKAGLKYFLEEEPKRPYTYFDIPDYNVQMNDMRSIIQHIVQYQEIHVYYGKFINVVVQKADKMVISAEISLEADEKIKRTSFIFEPTLETILQFFEKQIFASIMDQTIRESELARLASRVMTMSRAEDNLKDILDKLNSEKMRTQHRFINKKQANSMASILLTYH